MKKIVLLAIVGLSQSTLSQVGINTDMPNSTLSINGSLQAGYIEVTNSLVLSEQHYYVTFSGNTANQVITLPTAPSDIKKTFSGRIYCIKNISSQSVALAAPSGAYLRPNSKNISSYIIPSGSYAEVICNNNIEDSAVWDISFIASTTNTQIQNVQIYGGNATIPPHGLISTGQTNTSAPDFTNHSITKYDTSDWWVISKTSNTGNSSNNAKMKIVYEYQGMPFDINEIYPIFTSGNNSTYPDIFSASFISIANDGTNGKTRLTVSITRADVVNNTGNWQGQFILNILMAKKLQ